MGERFELITVLPKGRTAQRQVSTWEGRLDEGMTEIDEAVIGIEAEVEIGAIGILTVAGGDLGVQLTEGGAQARTEVGGNR